MKYVSRFHTIYNREYWHVWLTQLPPATPLKRDITGPYRLEPDITRLGTADAQRRIFGAFLRMNGDRLRNADCIGPSFDWN